LREFCRVAHNANNQISGANVRPAFYARADKKESAIAKKMLDVSQWMD
jgi:hypothetical protein